MAPKKPYMTSSDLINSVKTSISVPLTQNTYSDQNILDFASEELFLSQVPSILQYHEEYFVTNKVVPLEDNVSSYDIPARAIGMKLRDLYYQDTAGNLYEMSNVGPSNNDVFGNNPSGYSHPRYYYIEGNEVRLIPDIKTGVSGSLVMKYYLRPNSLVENDRAAVSNSFVKIITINNAALIAGNTITIGSNTLIAGTDFVIGATSTSTATNLATVANSLSGIDATSTSSDTSIFYKTLSTAFTTNNASAFIIDSYTGIRCDSIPEDFTDNMYVDILQTEGGHNTLDFDVFVDTGSVTDDTVFFLSIPRKFVIGDYVCMQHECIIPQIPNDLHMLLAQRTCARVLDSLGDAQGSQTQMTKIADLEQRQAVLISNRTEGSPKKVFNKHSLLRAGKSRRIRRGIF